MERFPKSLISFQRMFPDEAACAAWLFSMRWPEGFQCPGCGHDHGWALRAKAHTFECTSCHRQTSVTAGTILHGSKLDLTVWFWAAYLMATHSNGISALQLQKLSFLKTPSGRCPGGIIPENPIWHRFPPRRRVRDHRRGRDRTGQ